LSPGITALPSLAAQGAAVHDTVYLTLRQAQMAGQFWPGLEFVVRTLATRLGVSPMPVREALRRLVAEKALETGANGIVRVPLASRNVLRDLTLCRVLIEGNAAAQGARKGGPALANRLHAINAEMQAAAAARDIDRLLAVNQQFHFALYAAASSPIAMPLIESLWLQAGPYLNMMREALLVATILDHHIEVIAAAASGDAPAAAAAIAADIEEAARVMLELIPPDAQDQPGQAAAITSSAAR